MWCVTIIIQGKEGKQEVTWFETENEAKEFYRKSYREII
jgi:hypothetical protein